MARRVCFKTPSINKRNRIVLNVSGQRFMTDKTSLMRHPNTLLGSHMLSCYFDEVRQEYFFDRDPHLFRYILNYYQSGKLHTSPDDCPLAFKDELDFFGIPLCELEDCCWFSTNTDEKEKHRCHYAIRRPSSVKAVRTAPGNYLTLKRRNSEPNEATSQQVYKEGSSRRLTHLSHLPLTSRPWMGKRRESSPRKHNHLVEGTRSTHSYEGVNSGDDCKNTWKCKINCHCSILRTHKILQKLLNFLYGVFIILSVVTTTIETIDCETGIKCLELYPDLFFAVDSTFVAVFSLEFLIRFALSKNRCAFMKNLFNMIDLLAILPYYVSLIAKQFFNTDDVTLLITLRVLRVSRVMKLTRGSTRLQSFLYTLKNCSTDLLFLYFTFTLGILLFASVLYYVERTDNPKGFKSIPDSLWYTCVTMMTTG